MISKAARRYTIALYGTAEEKGALKEVTKDIYDIIDTIKSSTELRLFLHSPIVNKRKKAAVLNDIFGANKSPLTMAFLNLLVSRSRESLTADICEDYIHLVKEKEGIVDVHVKTAVELNDQERANMKQKIDSYTKLKSDMFFEIDKDILGGFVAKINDTVLDASIKRQLARLRESFLQGDFNLN